VPLEALHQTRTDETKKGSVIGEQPSEMKVTVAAEHHLPAIPGKPGELDGRLAPGRYSRRLSEAFQFKNNSRRIEKGMLMSVVDPQRLLPVGDNRAADSAENGVVNPLLSGQFGLCMRRPGAR
jgi:hypothetical protein